MGTLKRFYKDSSYWDDGAGAFDLFGTDFLSKEEFDKSRLTQSQLEVVEDDREVFIQDFWDALSQYENKVETA